MKEVLKQFALDTVTQMKNNNLISGNDELTGDGGAIQKILNVIIGALAIVAVIVMIIGGVSYMTSSGDAGKVKKAKDTILYGVIGLVVCALAFAIVNWVVGTLLAG